MMLWQGHESVDAQLAAIATQEGRWTEQQPGIGRN
jgi:hypothetical protein